MNRRLRHIAGLAIALALVGQVAAQSPANDAALDDPWAAVEPRFDPPKNETLAPRRAAPTVERAAPQTSGSWMRSIASLAGVLALIGLLSWGYRCAAGGSLSLAMRGRRPGLIEIVARSPLSPRQSLCLVRVGSRLTLVGVSGDRMTQLDVIDDAAAVASLLGESRQVAAAREAAGFQHSLEQEASAYVVTAPENEVKPATTAGAGLPKIAQRLRSLSVAS